MEKRFTFPAHDESGLLSQFHSEIIRPSPMFLEKTAAEHHPRVAEFVRNISKNPNKIYALVVALGCMESWGQNINGDSFPERGLAHEGAGYGYKTFELYAGVYPHHKNKGPEFRFGVVPISIYNSRMRRVELVIEIDIPLARQVGAQNIIAKIMDGGYPDLSMGARLPFDVCSICCPNWEKLWDMPIPEVLYRASLPPGHPDKLYGIAKKVEDYCEHLQGRMGTILPGGQMVTAINMYPKFFDISFVFIGADQTAKYLEKVAHRSHHFLPAAVLGEVDGVAPDVPEPRVKTSNVIKVSDIDKEIPAQSVKLIDKSLDLVPELVKHEPGIPNDTLREWGTKYPLRQILATLAHSGIILDPREFQYSSLCGEGSHEAAEELDDAGCVFTPPVRSDIPRGAMPLPASDFNPNIVKDVLPLLLARSFSAPAMARRIVIIKQGSAPFTKPRGLRKFGSYPARYAPFFNKLSAAYGAYRGSILNVTEFEKSARRNPYIGQIMGATENDVFTKHGGLLDTIGKAAEGVGEAVLAARGHMSTIPWQAFLALIPLTYIYASNLQARQQHGEALGVLQHFIANNPSLASAASFALSQYLHPSGIYGNIFKSFGIGETASAVLK